MTNRLSREKSPYLRQHAENPVDWYPWGDEAFRKAREEDKPIFLSVGYSSCHWCHVMARESFSDGEVAAIVNKHFVAVKVDREERPDIDTLYMAACHAMGEQGGWPLSVFLTPSGRPFFAGTYFPKRTRGTMPGFIEVLLSVARLWEDDRGRIEEAGDRVTEILRREASESGVGGEPDAGALTAAFDTFRRQYDDQYGGFGEAPKFPVPHRLSFLLRYHKKTGDPHALTMVTETLRRMRYGGVFDQVGLGFHRYSVDERWRVPHFEKMLVDQALCAAAYIEGFLVTGDRLFESTAREVFSYVLAEMTSTEGGFSTSRDAESGSEEGAAYLWTRDEVDRVLGDTDADLAADYFGIKREGNVPVPGFADGMNIPYVPATAEQVARRRGVKIEELYTSIESIRRRLSDARGRRPQPKTDDKVITALNGLMIGALAMGYRAFGETAYRDAAANAARFVLERLADGRGGLLRRYREGEAGIDGFLEDYAFFVWGLIELYEASFDVGFLEEAARLSRVMVDRFSDPAGGGFFTSARDGDRLVAETRDVYDGAGPSANGVAVENLARLAGLTGDTEFSDTADRILSALWPQIAVHPDGATRFLAAFERLRGPAVEVVIVGERHSASTRAMVKAVCGLFLPAASVLFVPEGDDDERRRIETIAPFVSSMTSRGGRAAAYICRDHTCREPLTDPGSVRAALAGAV